MMLGVLFLHICDVCNLYMHVYINIIHTYCIILYWFVTEAYALSYVLIKSSAWFMQNSIQCTSVWVMITQSYKMSSVSKFLLNVQAVNWSWISRFLAAHLALTLLRIRIKCSQMSTGQLPSYIFYRQFAQPYTCFLSGVTWIMESATLSSLCESALLLPFQVISMCFQTYI